MITPAELKEIADKAAADTGYSGSVAAEFYEFRELKVRWQRAEGWVFFQVSHFLREAPDYLIYEIIEGCYRDILGTVEGHSEQSPSLLTWISENRHKWYKEKVVE